MAHRRDAALLEEVLEGVKAPARTVRDAVGVEVVHVAAFHPVVPAAREGDEAFRGNLAVLGLPAPDVVNMNDEFGARAPYFPPLLKKRLTARPIRQKKSRMRCRMVR